MLKTVGYCFPITLNAFSKASCCLRSEDFLSIKHIEPDILRLLFISRPRTRCGEMLSLSPSQISVVWNVRDI